MSQHREPRVMASRAVFNEIRTNKKTPVLEKTEDKKRLTEKTREFFLSTPPEKKL